MLSGNEVLSIQKSYLMFFFLNLFVYEKCLTRVSFSCYGDHAMRSNILVSYCPHIIDDCRGN